MRIRFLLSIAFFALSFTAMGAEENAKKVKATLNEATVFFSGAELIHKASIQVAKGENNVWISDLSPNIDTNSLKISATKGVVIASYEYSHDYINLKESHGVEKVLKDSLEFYKRRISEYEISRQTNKDLLELLKANKTIGGSQNGLSVAELMKMMDYYSAKSNELNKQDAILEDKIEKAEEAVDRIEDQLSLESSKNVKSVGVLKLNLVSPLTTNSDFTITYYTKNANWIPYYDINIPNTQSKIQIASKAKVAQTTGLDWKKVKLTLSTAKPRTNKEAPSLDTWFLDFQDISRRNSYYETPNMSMVSSNANLRIRGVGTTKDTEKPLYIVNGVPASEEEVASLDPEMLADINVVKDASAAAVYGTRAANGVILITTKKLDDFVKRDEGELNSVYNIDLPYTILGNGKVQRIDLQTQSVEAEFKHYAVPKIAEDAFVLASIDNWQNLGLLSGKANITFGGSYVGETVINSNSVLSKLNLTLGADDRVSIKREKLQDFSSKKFIGSTIKQDFVYKITVKNNQNKSIKMTLKDQYPQSNQKDIQVEVLKQTSPTTSTIEETGQLNWDFELAPGESKEFKIGYSVKYPKDRTINL